MTATRQPAVANKILPILRRLNERESIHLTELVKIDDNLDKGRAFRIESDFAETQVIIVQFYVPLVREANGLRKNSGHVEATAEIGAVVALSKLYAMRRDVIRVRPDSSVIEPQSAIVPWHSVLRGAFGLPRVV